MTIDAAPNIHDAYRALYLLPTAPRELIDAVYATLLANTPERDRLRDAYELVTDASCPPGPSVNDEPSWPVNPWELLYLQPDAPRVIIDAAYRYRRGEPAVVEIAPSETPIAAAFEPGAEHAVGLSVYEELLECAGSPLRFPGEGSGVSADPSDEDLLSLIEDFAVLSAYEELLEHAADSAAADASPPHLRKGSLLSVYEELLSCATQSDSPPHSEERQGVSEHPTLTAADGATLVLAGRPLRIGTAPTCDAIVRTSGRVEARVWRNKGRVLVHALGDINAVLLNGRPVSWAVLDDGDELSVGPASYSFRA